MGFIVKDPRCYKRVLRILLQYFFIYIVFFPVIIFYNVKNFSHLRVTINLAVILFLFIFLGLRTEIGVDWRNYIRYFDLVNSQYYTFNYIYDDVIFALFYRLLPSYQTTLIVASFIYILCLFLVYRKNKNFFLALVVIYPNFIVIFGMNLERQILALCVIMILVEVFKSTRLQRLEPFVYFFSSFIHKFSLIFLIFNRNLKLWQVAILAVSSLIIVITASELLPSNLTMMEDYYITGYIFRFSYYLLFVIIRVLCYSGEKHWYVAFSENLFVISLFIAFIFPVGADRLLVFASLYPGFVCLKIFHGMPLLRRTSYHIILAIFSMVYLLFWLVFSNHASSWVPYRSIVI